MQLAELCKAVVSDGCQLVIDQVSVPYEQPVSEQQRYYSPVRSAEFPREGMVVIRLKFKELKEACETMWQWGLETTYRRVRLVRFVNVSATVVILLKESCLDHVYQHNRPTA